MMLPTRLTLPISDSAIQSLHTGDAVLLNGLMFTGRDKAHKWLTDAFVNNVTPDLSDMDYLKIKDILKNGALYHCGPVVEQLANGSYRMLSAGPTTSSREEPYQAGIIAHFGLKAVIGKGGMGKRTVQACHEHRAVYLHAVGGAAVVLAETIVAVQGVLKLEFGVPEAMWLIKVKDFPAVVTIDAHGQSLHDQIRQRSADAMHALLTQHK